MDLEKYDEDAPILNKKNFEQFINWRVNTWATAKLICENNGDTYLKSPEIVDFFDTLSKCLLHLTRQICQCNNKCTSMSFYEIGLSDNCFKVDNNNFYLGRMWQSCNSLGIKIYQGKMINVKDLVPIKDIITRMYDSIEFLSNDDISYFNKLQFTVYELKNHCLDDINCIKKLMRYYEPYPCSNPNFRYHMNEIENSIGVSILKYSKELGKNSTRKWTRPARSLENLNFFPIENIEKLYSNVEKTYIGENMDLNLSKVFLIVILFSVFAFIFYKIYKKVFKRKPILRINNNVIKFLNK